MSFKAPCPKIVDGARICRADAYGLDSPGSVACPAHGGPQAPPEPSAESAESPETAQEEPVPPLWHPYDGSNMAEEDAEWLEAQACDREGTEWDEDAVRLRRIAAAIARPDHREIKLDRGPPKTIRARISREFTLETGAGVCRYVLASCSGCDGSGFVPSVNLVPNVRTGEPVLVPCEVCTNLGAWADEQRAKAAPGSKPAVPPDMWPIARYVYCREGPSHEWAWMRSKGDKDWRCWECGSKPTPGAQGRRLPDRPLTSIEGTLRASDAGYEGKPLPGLEDIPGDVPRSGLDIPMPLGGVPRPKPGEIPGVFGGIGPTVDLLREKAGPEDAPGPTRTENPTGEPGPRAPAPDAVDILGLGREVFVEAYEAAGTDVTPREVDDAWRRSRARDRVQECARAAPPRRDNLTAKEGKDAR